MKKLALCLALASTAACGDQPAEVTIGSTSSTEPSTSTTVALVTTSTEAPTTTTAAEPVVEPEPVVTVPYVAPVTTRRTTTTVYYEPPSPQSRTVRGDTPPEYVKQCESSGNYQAVNPNGHYGAWQFSQSTWESVGGTGRPDHATPAEQDYRASILWANGAGAGHWECA